MFMTSRLSARSITEGKFDKCLHFLPICIARKLTIGLIIRYVSLNIKERIQVIMFFAPFFYCWGELGKTELLSKTTKGEGGGFSLRKCCSLVNCRCTNQEEPVNMQRESTLKTFLFSVVWTKSDL
jgi:hypothetical protein